MRNWGSKALTRPDISFTLSHNHRDVHVLKPAQGLKFRIMDLMGAAVVGSVVDVEAVTSVANVEGFVGRPEAARKTVGCPLVVSRVHWMPLVCG